MKAPKLTKKMRSVLDLVERGQASMCNRATLQALEDRGLIRANFDPKDGSKAAPILIRRN